MKSHRQIKTGARLLFLAGISLCSSGPLVRLSSAQAASAPLTVSREEVLAHSLSPAEGLHVDRPIQERMTDADSVSLSVVVDPSGRVETARGIDGPKKFFEAAERLEMNRVFQPFLKDGVPVRAAFDDYIGLYPLEKRPLNTVPFPPIKDPATLRMTLERTGCFGRCPAYRVEIAGDGLVTFQGRRDVLITGEHHAHISKSAVASLVQSFRAANYFSLDDSYSAMVTDSPSYATSIAFDGNKKKVEDYVGLQDGMPESVTALEKIIDRVAGTEKWLKETPETWPSLEAERWDFKTDSAANRVLFASMVRHGSPELVQNALDAGADPLRVPQDGQSPLAEAALKGETSMVEQMLGTATSVPPTLLFAALRASARAGDLELVRLFLEKGADVNGQPPAEIPDRKETILMAAASSGKLPVVEAVLANHPYLEAKDSIGETALMVLLDQGERAVDSLPISEALIKAGANVNARDDRQETPLFKACSSPLLIPVLLRAGAAPNVRDINGSTPLMACTVPDSSEALIKGGSDATLVGRNKQTASQQFRAMGIIQVADRIDAAQQAMRQTHP